MPDHARPNVFAGAYLDRRSAEREAGDWREIAFADPDTVFVVSRSTTHLVYPGEKGKVAYLRRDDPLVVAASPSDFVLLGWLNGQRHVLIDLEPSSEGRMPEGASFQELRPLVLTFDEQDAALLAYALAPYRSGGRAPVTVESAVRPPPREAPGMCFAARIRIVARSFFPVSTRQSSCSFRMASVRCSVDRRNGPPDAIPPSRDSSSPAKASRMR